MNAINRFGLLGLSLLAVLMAADAAAQSAAVPAQYGDRQAGSFGDIGQGHFGNTAEGNFTEKQFPRTQEGQVKQVEASSRPYPATQAAKPTESPYVVLPKPVDAR